MGIFNRSRFPIDMKKKMKRIFKSFGYDLVRLKGGLGSGTRENELLKIINSIQTDLILDVGANRGQFGKGIYSYGYKNAILSFEPLSKMHTKLTTEAQKHKNWHVYERCCIGDKEGITEINISNLVGNSSILPIKSTKFNVDQSHYVAKETTKQISLAHLNSNDLVKNSESIFVKMDVQGFEHIVLNGLKNVDYFIKGFYIELSLVKVYEGQEDYLYICNQLKQLGYDLVYITPEYITTNRMVQFNGVFLHNTLSY